MPFRSVSHVYTPTDPALCQSVSYFFSGTTLTGVKGASLRSKLRKLKNPP